MGSLRGKLLKSSNIVLPDAIVDGGIVVDDAGKIEAIFRSRIECEHFIAGEGTDVNVIDFADLVILPGVVDTHVHVNEPGRADWEGFSSATKAAAAGGVTTIADMPLNSIPPTTTLENLEIKAKVALDQIHVDVAFWGGVVPGNQGELTKLVDAGVIGFKCFLCPSGVEEFPHVTEKDLVLALLELQHTDSLLAFHAESEGSYIQLGGADPTQYETYLQTRPPQMEVQALRLIAKLSANFKTRLHIVHLSAAEGIPVLMAMRLARRDKGDPNWAYGITVETCYHYLTLDAESVPPSRSDYKCAPPVRSAVNREALWQSVKNGSINLVVSDHSPCTPNLKTKNFLTAWGGISSLQFGLSLMWTEGSKRGLSLIDIAKLICSAPAELCKLNDRKGSIKVNLDADFVIFDPFQTYTVAFNTIHHKNKLTPYDGRTLTGRVLQTYLRGNLIYDAENLHTGPNGTLLLSANFLKNIDFTS